MEDNEILKKQLLEAVETQINNNDPPETLITLKRLLNLGYSKLDAKLLIAQCLAVEIYNVAKNKKPYDEKRYVTNLKNLPNEPA